LKRAFTHKVEYFPSCAADNNALAKLSGGKLPGELANTVKANSPEVNRRACTSAAMIGLAISMGASSLLLPNQSDEAIAAEPIAGEPIKTSAASETAVELPTSTAELQPTVSNLQAEALKAAVPEQAPTVIEPHVQAEQLRLVPTSKVDEASLTTPNSFSAKSVPETQVRRISSVGSIVKPQVGEPEQLTQLYKVDSPRFQPSSPTQLSTQLQAGQSVNFPSKINDLLKATQEEAVEQLRHRSSNDLAQLNFEESTNKLATPKIARREFAVSLKPLTTKEAVQRQQPVVKGLETSGNSSSAVTSLRSSPKKLLSPRVMQLSATTSSPVVMPVSLPATSVTSPVLIAPVAEKSSNATEFVKTTISATPAVPKPVVVEPQQSVAKTTVYQVKPGDTVDEIAEAYTVTPKQLIRANKIDNPNIIQINQQLRIPLVNSTSLVSQIQPRSVDGTLASQSELSNTKINQASFPTGVLPAVSQQPLSSTKYFPASATLVSTVAGNAIPKPTLLVAKESNSEQKLDQPQILQANSKDLATSVTITPPVSTLLNNNQPQQPSVPQLIQGKVKGQTTLPTVMSPASTPLNSGNLQQQESVQAQAIQANSNFSYTTAPIVIPVPQPLSNSEAQQPIQVQQKSSPSVSTVQPATGAITIPVPSPQVATAPTEPSNYNPKIQTPIGDTVSPDLPPIQGPTPYLPPTNPPAFQGYIWPAKGVFTSGYGRRWGRMHKGIDIAAPIGTPIVAVAPGIVRRSGWNSGGYGNLVEVQHPDGSFTRYAHNSRLLVVAGQEVQQGQQIAEMGSTGHSTGPHLHFEIHAYGKGAVNPIAYLQRRAS
jgi:murein DD-endopeptidase MepM/ murein hydrolase activator NlpD